MKNQRDEVALILSRPGSCNVGLTKDRREITATDPREEARRVTEG